MIITSIGLTQKQNTVGEFIITFREIFIVETQTANGLKIPKVRNLGRTQPKEVNMESLIGKAGKVAEDIFS